MYLPLYDLLTVVCRVNHQWRDLVYRPEFMAWKKSYYKYKKDQIYSKLLDRIDPTSTPNLETAKGMEWLRVNHPSIVSTGVYDRMKLNDNDDDCTQKTQSACLDEEQDYQPTTKKPKLELITTSQYKQSVKVQNI